MQNLTANEWQTIREVARFGRFGAGSRLANEGGTDQTVFAIETGLVNILLGGEDGSQYLVGLRGAGDLVGEMAAIDGLPRSASMVAKGVVTAYTLTAEQFRSFLAEHPDASIRIMQSMSRRLRQAASMHVLRGEALSLRIASTLVALAADVDSVELKLTQQELADWVGATREATGRVLAEFRDQRLVETARGRIIVLDLEGLSSRPLH